MQGAQEVIRHARRPRPNEPKQFREFGLVHHAFDLIASFAATADVREGVVTAAADRQYVVEAEVVDVEGETAIRARLVEGVAGDEVAFLRERETDLLAVAVRPALGCCGRIPRRQVVSLFEQMLTLHRQSATAKTPHEQARLKRQIAATDRQIDRLVYELYGLTEEEVRIVEEGTITPKHPEGESQ